MTDMRENEIYSNFINRWVKISYREEEEIKIAKGVLIGATQHCLLLKGSKREFVVYKQHVIKLVSEVEQ